MPKNARLTFRTLFLLLFSLMLVLPSTAYAQDDDYDDYDDYDDEYYDDYDDFGEDYSDEDVDATYEVDGLELLDDPTDEHLELWDTFVVIIPHAYFEGNITFFEVISDPDTSGYVYGDDDDEEKFVLGLNVVELEEPLELQHTVIHEFAHMLTINADQIDMQLERGGTCPTFELDEGCSEDNSYLFAFYSEFYGDDQDTEGADYDEDEFVTDYAAENIAEDMAESFTFFVLRDQPEGDTIAEEKILFFYNYNDLVELRDEIRDNIDQ